MRMDTVATTMSSFWQTTRPSPAWAALSQLTGATIADPTSGNAAISVLPPAASTPTST
jgi:hypothetical protein